MRLHVILRYVGLVFLINALFLFLSAVVSVIYSDSALRSLLYSAFVTMLFGIVPLIFVPPTQQITNNEGLVIVVSSWLLSCLIGSLPYILWGGEFSFTNAWFESVSGYTTTGSSILTDIEILPHGLLFWRALTHWLGGMGIIIFVLSFLPPAGLATMVLYRSEMSPLAKDNFRQNARTTLRILFTVYLGLTILETVALLLAGMNLFDALSHSFSTIATGGFSTKNTSLAYYDSVQIELVIIVFMILSGLHFGLIYSTILWQNKELWQSTTVRYYLAAFIFGVAFTAISLKDSHFATWADSFRYATFQIITLGTSTGFANADSSIWPSFAQVILIFFTLQCACAGSTSGGIKADRMVLFAKAVGRQIKQLFHPNAVVPLRFNKKNITEAVLVTTVLYICAYLAVVFLSTVILTMLGVDALSAFSGSAAAMGNVGPGLATVGSLENYNHIPTLGKWVLTLTMLLGRLEIYALIMFFLPQMWKMRRHY